MVPIIQKPPITPRQKAAALAVAGAIDLFQVVIFPSTLIGAASPVQDAMDVIAVLLLLSICGFKWQFLAAFLLELVPVIGIFPTWTAFVLTLPTAQPSQPLNVQRITAQPPRAGRQPQQNRTVVDVDAVVVPPVQPPPARVR